MIPCIVSEQSLQEISMTTSKACACYLVNIAQPFTDVLKALGVGDVIDQHDAHGSSVVGGGDGVEPFLARRVPAETQLRCDMQTRVSRRSDVQMMTFA